jgi:N-acetylglucosamine-6-phosphate deacetylase
MQLPSIALLDQLQQLSGGRVKMITLAAELPGAIELCTHATAQGIVVAVGHTLAGLEELNAFTAAGGKLFTHLGYNRSSAS